MLMLRAASREHGTLTLSMPTSFDRILADAPLRLCAFACDLFAILSRSERRLWKNFWRVYYVLT